MQAVDLEAGGLHSSPAASAWRTAPLCLLGAVFVALAAGAGYIGTHEDQVRAWFESDRQHGSLASGSSASESFAPSTTVDSITQSRTSTNIPEEQRDALAGFQRLSSSDSFIGVHRNQATGRVVFELLSANIGVPFVVDALASKADGSYTLYHEPVADADNPVFHFAASTTPGKLDLVQPNLRLRTEPGTAYARVVADAVWTGWEQSFELLMTKEMNESSLYYIDVTDWIVSSGCGVMSSAGRAKKSRIGTEVRAFPHNIVAEAEYEFEGDDGNDVVLGVRFAMSMLARPGDEAPLRQADDRIGFFATRYRRVGLAQGEDLTSGNTDKVFRLIHRWNLKPSGVLREVNGSDLQVPVKPITFYIDPSVPERWRSSVVRGVLGWSVAFEAAGWKDAVRAIRPDDEDWPADYDAGDIRYSTISWAISTRSTYAIAPSTVDPRTGEILNADIMFTHSWISAWLGEYDEYHTLGNKDGANTMTGGGIDPGWTGILRQSPSGKPHAHVGEPLAPDKHGPCGFAHLPERAHLAAAMVRGATAAANSPQLEKEEFIRQAISEVTMHEVGHALGLRHNFKGSHAIPWEQLGNRTFTSEHGLTASVMDYLPPAVHANPDEQGDFFTTVVGVYDKHAIEYGYTLDSSALGHLASRSDDEPALAFGTDEDGAGADGSDPTISRWDLSSDPIRYTEATLEVAATLLHAQIRDAEEGFAVPPPPFQLTQRVEGILKSLLSASVIAAKHVGGIVRSRGKQEVVPVPAEYVRRAISVLQKVITSDSMIPPASLWQHMQVRAGWCDGLNDYCFGSRHVDILEYVRKVRAAALGLVLNHGRLRDVALSAWALEARGQDSVSVASVLRIITNFVWNSQDETTSGARRQIQRDHVAFLQVLDLGGIANETTSLAGAELAHLYGVVTAAVQNAAFANETPTAALRAHWIALLRTLSMYRLS